MRASTTGIFIRKTSGMPGISHTLWRRTVGHVTVAAAAIDCPTLLCHGDQSRFASTLTDGRLAHFRDRNLFFGGCQAVERHHETHAFSGGGDPRRGGAVVFA